MSGSKDVGGGAAAGGGVAATSFFLPSPKKPRFVFALLPASIVGSLLSRRDPADRAAPWPLVTPFEWPFVLPFVWPLVLPWASVLAVAAVGGLETSSSTSSSRSVESPSSSPAFLGIPRTGVRPGGRSYTSGSESESLKRLWNCRGAASSSSLESAKRLLKALPRSGAFDLDVLANVEVDLGAWGIGGSISFALFALNLPPGDSDLILNLEDLGRSGLGDDGLIDCRNADCGRGGEMDRTGAVALIVGAGSVLIEERMVNWFGFRRPRDRVRWKLLAEASESLSYVGAAAMGLWRAAAGRL